MFSLEFYEYLKILIWRPNPTFLMSCRSKEGNLRPDFQELSLISLCAAVKIGDGAVVLMHDIEHHKGEARRRGKKKLWKSGLLDKKLNISN